MMIINEQNIASNPSVGPVLLLAGAGSGKTRTLIERVRRTIQEGRCSAEEILILTFSIKAAHELKERLCIAMPDAKSAFTGTIHSFALHVIKEYAAPWLHEHYSGNIPRVMDEDQNEKLFKKVFSEIKNDFYGIPIHVVSHLMTKKKDHIADILSGGVLKSFKDLSEKIQHAKRVDSVIDFDDIIRICCDILRDYEDIKDVVRKKFRFVFVDEYQDISEDLFCLLKLLAGEKGNIFVVGDDFQSIYGFRNANIAYIVEFQKYFPDGKILKLVSNYRSKKEITELGKRIITKNRFRTKKHTVSVSGNGGLISAYPSLSDRADSRIIQQIISKHSSESKSLVILCRTNSQIDTIKFNLQKLYPEILPMTECMTIHASKGLEFDTVIIAGIENKIFPSNRNDIEEERRVLYVGITRAKTRLVLVYRYGEQGIPRFIRETVLSVSWFIRHPLWVLRDYSRMMILKIMHDVQSNDHSMETSEPVSSAIV